MFEGFANVWTIVASARQLRTDRPLARIVAGERVVLFRDAAGQAVALIDRCPHRGVALSLGRVEAGVIECPFHGWRFDGAGNNCHVPWNPDAKRERLGATPLPVREAGGLLWLFTGFAPRSEPLVSETLARGDIAIAAQSVVWDVHWTRVMENMLDSPHLPFVHARTIGRGLRDKVGGRMTLDWTPTDYGARIENRVDDETRRARLDYRFPNAMELFIDPPGKIFRLMAICLPEAEGRTRLTIYTLRSFARARLFDPLFAWANRRIAAEDKRVLETSWPREVPLPAQEHSVRTDQPTLAFRKIYFDRLRGSSAALAPRATGLPVRQDASLG